MRKVSPFKLTWRNLGFQLGVWPLTHFFVKNQPSCRTCFWPGASGVSAHFILMGPQHFQHHHPSLHPHDGCELVPRALIMVLYLSNSNPDTGNIYSGSLQNQHMSGRTPS